MLEFIDIQEYLAGAAEPHETNSLSVLEILVYSKE